MQLLTGYTARGQPDAHLPSPLLPPGEQPTSPSQTAFQLARLWVITSQVQSMAENVIVTMLFRTAANWLQEVCLTAICFATAMRPNSVGPGVD
jgi:hypothetical protein